MNIDMAEVAVWRVVVEYGPAREVVASVELRASRALAEEAAHALHVVFSKIAVEQRWAFGVIAGVERPPLK